MQIDVLGTGSSGNCYQVKTGKTRLLLECGLPYKKIQEKLNFTTSSIDGCLISHEHMDHAKAAKDLMKAGINCYMSKGTAEALRLEGHRLKIFPNKKDGGYAWQNIGEVGVKPFESVHDVKEPTNFYLKNLKSTESLMFVTDTAYMKYRIPNVDYLMIECNYIKKKLDENVSNGNMNLYLRNRIVKNHMSLETLLESLKVADLSKCKKIYLLHLSDNNSDMYEIKDAVQKVTGCEVWV